MDIKTVGVVGAGTMGNGIAHVFAKSGYAVVLCDVEERFVQRALDTIGKNLEREASKGKITAEEKDAALGRIRTTTDREALATVDFVVEAATEKFEIKSQLFRDLDRICRPETMLATNTSSISITKLGGADEASGESRWHALLQSGAGDEAGGSDPRAGDRRRRRLNRCAIWR